MLALGDSVMLGCKLGARLSLDYRVRVDAAIGRQIRDTITDVNHYRKKHRLPKVVIIQVGNNGPLLYARPRRAEGGATWRAGRRRRQRPQRHELAERIEHAITGWLRDWRAAHLADWYHHSTNRCSRTARIRGRMPATRTRASSLRRCAKRTRKSRIQIARMRLLRGLCSTSAFPSSSSSGGR